MIWVWIYHSLSIKISWHVKKTEFHSRDTQFKMDFTQIEHDSIFYSLNLWMKNTTIACGIYTNINRCINCEWRLEICDRTNVCFDWTYENVSECWMDSEKKPRTETDLNHLFWNRNANILIHRFIPDIYIKIGSIEIQ